MKRWIIAAIFAFGSAAPASAQSWQSFLKNALQALTGKTDETETAAAAASGFPAAQELLGTWTYRAPAMEYTGSDMLASLATSTLKGQLPSYYQQAGLQSGTGTIVFDRNDAFRAVLTEHRLEGTYSYDAATGTVTIRCPLDSRSVCFTGSAKLAEGVLTMLFEANAVLASLQALPQYAQNEKLQQISTILQNYPGVMLGAELTR